MMIAQGRVDSPSANQSAESHRSARRSIGYVVSQLSHQPVWNVQLPIFACDNAPVMLIRVTQHDAIRRPVVSLPHLP